MKTYVALVIVMTVLAVAPALRAQQCSTPVTSWEGSYTLSASANNVAAPGGWTVTMNETTSSNNLSLPLGGAACNQAGWQGSLNDPSASGSYTSHGSISDCMPGTEFEDWSASGSPNPNSAAGVVMDFSKNTYYFWPAMVVNGTETTTNCSGNKRTSSGLPLPLYPNELLSGQAGVLPLPSSPGPLNGNVTFQGTDFSFGEMVPFTLTFALSPQYTDDDDCKKAGGSNIGCQNQSLGEDIPITGTGFNLHYEGNRASGAVANPVASSDALMMGGWTLSVHNAYDPGTNTLFLGDGSQRNGYQLGALVMFNGNTLFTSESGSEVYVFAQTQQGTLQHVQTLKPQTGALIYQFGYGAAGTLVTVTDGSGNITTIQRDGSEHATAIIAPFGQTTTLTTDANGFLSQATDPLGNSVKLSSTGTGLLTSRTDENGNLFTYTYDSNGRLIMDADSRGWLHCLNPQRMHNSGSARRLPSPLPWAAQAAIKAP